MQYHGLKGILEGVVQMFYLPLGSRSVHFLLGSLGPYSELLAAAPVARTGMAASDYAYARL